jgi:hypothetical protein
VREKWCFVFSNPPLSPLLFFSIPIFYEVKKIEKETVGEWCYFGE